jgi:hypothetical protein
MSDLPVVVGFKRKLPVSIDGLKSKKQYIEDHYG